MPNILSAIKEYVRFFMRGLRSFARFNTNSEAATTEQIIADAQAILVVLSLFFFHFFICRIINSGA